MNSRNLTLLTDLYELTMMQGYFERQENEVVVFDVFFRNNPCNSGYSIAAGLEQVIEYIKNLNFSYDDVDYLRKLGIFSEDFLQYLSGYHFTGSIVYHCCYYVLVSSDFEGERETGGPREKESSEICLMN